MTESERKVRRRRPTRYPVKVTVALAPDIGADIRRTAEQEATGMADLVRQSLTIGWPRLKDRLRKRRARKEAP